VADVRSFEFHKARRCIQAGVRETELHLPEIRKAVTRRRRSARRNYASVSSSPARPTS
jgi:hypothetical protein